MCTTRVKHARRAHLSHYPATSLAFLTMNRSPLIPIFQTLAVAMFLTGCTTSQSLITNARAQTTKNRVSQVQTARGHDNAVAFAPEMMWYYSALSDNDKAMYGRIADGLRTGNAGIFLAEISPSDEAGFDQRIERLFDAVVQDHPEMFWVKWYNIIYTYIGDTTVRIVLEPKYHALLQTKSQLQDELESVLRPILDALSQYPTQFEKERYVYSWLQTRVTYDKDARWPSNIIGALIDKRATCEGFSSAFQYIMLRAGISATRVSGMGDDRHSWNLVRIDGQCYNVDATTLTPTPGGTFGDGVYVPSFDYFNLTDESYERDSRNKRNSDRGENVLSLERCKTPFSFVQTFGSQFLYDFYASFVPLTTDKPVTTPGEHFTILKNTGRAVNDNPFVTYEIVIGQQTADAIVSAGYEERKKGYLDALWNEKFKGCTNRSTRESYKIAGDAWIIKDEEHFFDCE